MGSFVKNGNVLLFESSLFCRRFTNFFMIKVALFLDAAVCSMAKKQCSLLATRLPKSEFDLSIIQWSEKKGRSSDSANTDFANADIPVLHLPVLYLQKRGKFDPFVLRKIKRFLRSQQPDILSAWIDSSTIARQLFYRSLFGGHQFSPRLIISEQAVSEQAVSKKEADHRQTFWQRWLTQPLLNNADCFLSHSRTAQQIDRDRGFSDEQIALIPYGIELPAQPLKNQYSVTRNALLAQFGIPANAPIIGFIGPISRQNRIVDLVWAMQLVRQLNDQIHCLIIGDGDQRQPAEQLAKQMHCDHLIRFIEQKNLTTELQQACDLFWFTNDSGTISTRLMEAMATGRPVIATKTPANCELVSDGENGFLVDIGDCVGFAQFTDRIVANQTLAAQLGNAGRRLIEEKQSIENMVAAHANLYRKVASHNGE